MTASTAVGDTDRSSSPILFQSRARLSSPAGVGISLAAPMLRCSISINAESMRQMLKDEARDRA
jgi:hypothetical protein